MLLAKIVILYPVILKTKCLNKICSCLQMPNNIHLQNVIMTRSHMYFLIYIWCCQMVWSHMHESACIIFTLFLFLLLFPLCCSKLLMHDVITCSPPFFFLITSNRYFGTQFYRWPRKCCTLGLYECRVKRSLNKGVL